MADGWSPAGIDPTKPNVARMYDYYLAGKDNFAADREAAERVLAAAPDGRLAVRESRAFLGRAVRFLANEVGIRQFLDIGTGLPTQGQVHEVAGEFAPDARVVYVDNDPVVLTHGRALLANTDNTTVLEEDLRQPEKILCRIETNRLIDFDQPLAVLLVAILHFIADKEDPAGILTRLRDAMAPGSYLVISHGTGDSRPEAAAKIEKVYQNATAPIIGRTHQQILRFFDGFALVEPGLVYVPEWRPDHVVADPERTMFYGGVGRKR